MKRENKKNLFGFYFGCTIIFTNTTNKQVIEQNIRIQEPLDSKWGKKKHLQKIEVNKKLNVNLHFFILCFGFLNFHESSLPFFASIGFWIMFFINCKIIIQKQNASINLSLQQNANKHKQTFRLQNISHDLEILPWPYKFTIW